MKSRSITPTPATGQHRSIVIKVDNCSPRVERLLTSICELFCAIKQEEWEQLLAAKAALVVGADGRAQVTYDMDGGNRAN